VIVTYPDLMNKEVLAFEELERQKPMKPSFSDAPFIDGELVSENPAPKSQALRTTQGQSGTE
jgi:hypothetical protein